MRKFQKEIVSDQPAPPQVIFDHKGVPFALSAVRDVKVVPGRLNNLPVWKLVLVEMEPVGE